MNVGVTVGVNVGGIGVDVGVIVLVGVWVGVVVGPGFKNVTFSVMLTDDANPIGDTWTLENVLTCVKLL